MSLRLRFLLSLLAMMAVMAGPALYAVTRVNTLRDIVLELRGQAAQSAMAVRRLDAALVDLDRHQRVYVATADAEVGALAHSGSADVGEAIATLQAAGFGDLVDRAGIGLAPLEASLTRLDALVSQGQLEEATTYLLAQATPRVQSARAAVPELAAAIDMRTGARVPVAQQSAVAAATATTIAVLLAVSLAFGFALSSARILSGPVERLRRAMARVAEGTFEAPSDLPYERPDEVGDLSRSFRTMTRRLSELDRMKAEFVGSVSHDLKTPVSVIAGYAELMQEELRGVLSPRQDELLRSLAEQTHALQRRVDQVLDVSRMESGQVRLDLEQIDVRHFADEVYRGYEADARSRGIRLSLSVHEATPQLIVADPDVLRTDVIGNLMANALESTPSGGMIRIALRPDGDRVSIEISDTGVGIPHDQVDRVFDRYYQSRGGNGTGLGLTIAKAGVESLGGRIEVHSRVGRGTHFRVTLPVAPPGTIGTAAAASLHRQPPHHR